GPHLRPGAEPEPAARLRRGLRRVGGTRGRVLRRLAPAYRQPGAAAEPERPPGNQRNGIVPSRYSPPPRQTTAGMPSAAEQLLETADRLVDEILLRVLAALLTAQRAVRTIDERAAHDARDERRIGPHADIRQATGQAKRDLEQLLVVRRPARVLDAANDVGGERRPGHELRRQVEAAVETRRPATGDRVGRRTHHEVVGPRLPVGDPGGGAQLLE